MKRLLSWQAVEGRERLKQACTELRARHKEALKEGAELKQAQAAAAALLKEKDALIEDLK